MEDYTLIVGIVLCVLGVLTKVGWLNFLIARYEWFQKAIRKNEFSVDKERVVNFYLILFFVIGVPFLILGIIGFIVPIDENITFWIIIALVAIGVLGIIYLNASKRFIKPLETS